MKKYLVIYVEEKPIEINGHWLFNFQKIYQEKVEARNKEEAIKMLESYLCDRVVINIIELD